MRNTVTIIALLISIAYTVWTVSDKQKAEIYEPVIEASESQSTLTKETVYIQDSILKAVQIPDQAETPAVYKTTPKDSSPRNSDENLDADALDEMFKDAAELIL